jgi:hypothetical protein
MRSIRRELRRGAAIAVRVAVSQAKQGAGKGVAGAKAKQMNQEQPPKQRQCVSVPQFHPGWPAQLPDEGRTRPEGWLEVGQKSMTLLLLTIRTHGKLCHLSAALVTL